ncbi:MAG: pilus assembly protein [Gemmataceae bacterium]|nr:pilus assembly protein [Gemmataceae bacterium]
MLRRRNLVRTKHRGVAAAELAILLPFLAFLFVIAIDFSRCFYYLIAVTNCARNGAVYASSAPNHATDTTGIQKAALADAAGLNPTPDVTSATGTDSSSNPYVRVTVSWTFRTVTNFPGVPNQIVLSRTVQMRVAPVLPKNS